MAKIYDNRQSFRWQPSVFELKDHIALGGQLYDKSTLAPIPFQTVDINSYSKDHLITAKTSWVRETDGTVECVGLSTWLGGANLGHSSFMVDDSDDSIAYVICPRDDSTYLQAQKINLNTFDIITSASTQLGSDGGTNGRYDYPGQAYIFDQDNDYIYYMHKHKNTRRQSYNSTYQPVGMPLIGWISKTTMGQSGEFAADVQMETATYIGNVGTTHFYATCGTYWDTEYIDSRNQITIRKFDTASRTGSTVLTYTPTDVGTHNSFAVATRPFDQGSDVMHMYYTMRNESADDGFTTHKVEIDMQAETATASGVSYNWNGANRSSVFTRNDINDRNHKIWSWTMDDGSNHYVSHMVTETPGQFDVTMDAFEIHTFLIGGADKGTLTYKATLNPGFRIRGIMPLEADYTKFVLFGDSHSEVYTWNESIEEYVYTSTINFQCHGAAVDSLNRLWMVDEANNTHLLSSFSPLTVTVIPENSEYNYQGSTINTYINVSAYDIDNARVATNVRLVLEGSTYFTDDTQVKEITTSASGETQVNIKVTGTSFTRVLASVVV